jgi:hypothetical protein
MSSGQDADMILRAVVRGKAACASAKPSLLTALSG